MKTSCDDLFIIVTIDLVYIGREILRNYVDRSDIAYIRPGASYAVRNDPGDGISALPKVTYHDYYTLIV